MLEQIITNAKKARNLGRRFHLMFERDYDVLGAIERLNSMPQFNGDVTLLGALYYMAELRGIDVPEDDM